MLAVVTNPPTHASQIAAMTAARRQPTRRHKPGGIERHAHTATAIDPSVPLAYWFHLYAARDPSGSRSQPTRATTQPSSWLVASQSRCVAAPMSTPSEAGPIHRRHAGASGRGRRNQSASRGASQNVHAAAIASPCGRQCVNSPASECASFGSGVSRTK